MIWDQLDAALLRYVPLLGRSLQAPLAAAESAWLGTVDARGVGIAAAYGAHDGARQAGGIFALLPTPAAFPWTRATRWQTARAVRAELARLATCSGAGKNLFPIGRVGTYRPNCDDDDDQEHHCIAIATATGDLLALTYQEFSAAARLLPLGLTWSSYLGSFLRAIQTGDLSAYRDDYQVLRLKPAAPARPLAQSPRSDAAVLLQLLRERSLLNISGAPSAELLAQTRGVGVAAAADKASATL